ncbi:Zinc transporter 5 [Acorus calamus]|uniref:Zinc transporter 5 n=1 Tax=Acorus calamus TaxID=4465 RepID=A0AAV9DZJ0_ACOCL|nr:Zinc transporter 5 [Acorus calamus]
MSIPAEVEFKIPTTTSAVGLFLFKKLIYTTPTGIAIKIVVASSYNENSLTTLVIEGILNGASAGVLIYMALVDFIVADFKSQRMHGTVKSCSSKTIVVAIFKLRSSDSIIRFSMD